MQTDIIVIIAIFIAGFLLFRYVKRNNSAQNYQPTSSKKLTHPPVSVKQSTASQPTTNTQKSEDHISPPDDFLVFELLDKQSEKLNSTFLNDLDTLRRPHPMLMHLTRDITQPKELFEVIRSDPELVAKVLTIVNSAVYSVRKPITNINHAIIFLGVLQVKNIATQFALERSVAFSSPQQETAYKRLWNASFLASTIGLLLAKELNIDNSAEISTRCLLSYLGDIAILSAKPNLAHLYIEKYALFTRVKHIQAQLGITPAVVGESIAQNWKLPDAISSNFANNLLPLVDSLDSNLVTEEQFKETLLCYYACRLADMYIFEQTEEVADFDQLNYQSIGKVEFYYAQKHLQSAGLEGVNRVIKSPQYQRKIKDMIDHFNQ